MEVTPYVADEFAKELMTGIFVSSIVFGAIIAIVFYVFRAIGVYKLSKNRGYKKPWLAFIPFVNSYVLGALADNINLCIQKRTSFRFILLIAETFTSVIGMMSYPLIFKMMNTGFIYTNNPAEVMDGMSSFMAFGALSSLLGIATMVITGFVLYRIFMDYEPRNGMIYLILSLLFQITPFFLFAIRNKPSVSMYYAQQNQQQQYNQYNN